MSFHFRLRALLPVLLAPAALAQSPALVLTHVTLIDGTDQPARPDAAVVIKNGWIVAVGAPTNIPIPPGARVVDLTGRYLLPGFIEMHGHLAIAAWQIDSSKAADYVSARQQFPRMLELTRRLHQAGVHSRATRRPRGRSSGRSA